MVDWLTHQTSTVRITSRTGSNPVRGLEQETLHSLIAQYCLFQEWIFESVSIS